MRRGINQFYRADRDRYSPISCFTFANFATANSSSAGECAAEICVRIACLALGHDGQREADDLDALGQHRFCETRGERGITQQDGR